MAETEMIDRLFLELAQFTRATTPERAMLNSILALPDVESPVSEESVRDVVESALEYLRTELQQVQSDYGAIRAEKEAMEARLATALDKLRDYEMYEAELALALGDAPIKRLNESDSTFFERYTVWFRDKRHVALGRWRMKGAEPMSTIDKATEPQNEKATRCWIVFDGPPSHESGRFVEVENAMGQSVRAGEWLHRADGFWQLGPFVDGRAISADDALRIARGCLDYGGGYQTESARKIFYHGIQTVITALSVAVDRGLDDSQVRVLHSIGATAAPEARLG